MSSSTVEKIKERLSIVDVISSYLKLEKAGGNFKAPCPFHNEKTPSFFISPSRGSYYCFGCGVKGDIFTFVEQFEGLDFKGALKVLADCAGVQIEAWNIKEDSGKDRLYRLMESATIFYQRMLEESSEAREYLKKRGAKDEIIRSFRIGYAPDTKNHGWRALVIEMRKAGFSDEELVTAGLAKHPEENPNGELYDRFRDRVMFPLSDTGGRVIAFSGRILHPDASNAQGKYINSPETPIFKKGSTLYALDKAKFDIRKKDFAILVEGQMDLVLSHQAGFTNTVASSGTALGDSIMADSDQGLLSGLGQVRALSNNLVIAYDADKAGLRAAGRAEKIGLSLGMNVKVAKLPKDLDPADTILRDGVSGWKKIIDESDHIVSVYLSVLMEHNLTEHTRMRAVRDKILPYVAVMPSAVERAHFIKQISQKTGIPDAALSEDIDSLIAKEKKIEPIRTINDTSLASHKISVPRSSRIEDRLYGILFWQESLAEPIINTTSTRAKMISSLGETHVLEATRKGEEKKNEIIFQAELLYDKNKHLQKEVDELLSNLEEETLARRIESIMADISSAEREGNMERVQLLLNSSREITSRLNTIKNSRYQN